MSGCSWSRTTTSSRRRCGGVSERGGLEAEGYNVTTADTGGAAIAAWPDHDLILLDLGLPDVDGLDVCRQIRAADATIPVIMLTARETEIDKVVGLDAGAVDYITKPFGLAELLARLRAHLRRAVDVGVPGSLLDVGSVHVDTAARRVWVDSQEIALRAKEFELLTLLMANAGKVVTREQLMAQVWDERWFGSTKTLDVHMASLRRKLGDGPGRPSKIATVRGVGHRFEVE